jgi:hypothetical protein
MPTFPVCPVCNGKKTVPQDDCGGRRLDREPCGFCNANGIVSFENFQKYMDEQKVNKNAGT